jgi:hypothetical protein
MIEIDYVSHGTICVLPYIARLRSTRTAGRIAATKVRVLDVYADEDEDWHQVASHMASSGHAGRLGRRCRSPQRER